jgi:hypothetical protein
MVMLPEKICYSLAVVLKNYPLIFCAWMADNQQERACARAFSVIRHPQFFPVA